MSYLDRIQKRTYPRGNTATILNYLEELILINAKEVGLLPIPEEMEGYQDLEVTSSVFASLAVPEAATSATIMVEANISSENTTRVVRFKEFGIPTPDSGFALGDNDIFELVGYENLQRFKVIAIESELTQFLRVQFYTTAQTASSI
ncbi:hypothetical protein [Aquimarina pacifica]|uniref:hypothetical protein n=1 Tax=Aquimarina pacifica TaxID=1296415 RepID=UPI0004715FCB|nr:hypothetical protein [Aquimarina pacifica]